MFFFLWASAVTKRDLTERFQGISGFLHLETCSLALDLRLQNWASQSRRCAWVFSCFFVVHQVRLYVVQGRLS